ncbi:helix-turn-helix domain-containing protein [Amycolatopsis sp. CA-126428]|uniref:helix-turn-helix domain-containing protein n=1 Tax=Amycolatopsis sp. CA-126428 TaxID=2073158 RepID=UPI000CD25600|nr:helix-turn-helix transcriptional regulator [Amycolatopsis sp. CA-126428]
MAPPPLSTATAAFGARIRAHRQQLGYTQELLAHHAGLHWTFIGQVERGRRNVTLHNILKLAAALKVNPAVLVDGLEPPPSTAAGTE